MASPVAGHNLYVLSIAEIDSLTSAVTGFSTEVIFFPPYTSPHNYILYWRESSRKKAEG